MGERIADAMLVSGMRASTLHRHAHEQIPAGSTSPEILESHGFEVAHIIKTIRSGLTKQT